MKDTLRHFIAGLLLGAQVTSAVFYFLNSKNSTQKEQSKPQQSERSISSVQIKAVEEKLVAAIQSINTKDQLRCNLESIEKDCGLVVGAKPEPVTCPEVVKCPEIPTNQQSSVANKEEVPDVKITEAPKFFAEIPAKIESNAFGEGRIAWKPVEGALRYRINVKTMDGKSVKQFNTWYNAYNLKGLPLPTGAKEINYLVSVQGLNRHDEPGKESIQKEFHLRRPKNIYAPSVKAITIED